MTTPPNLKSVETRPDRNKLNDGKQPQLKTDEPEIDQSEMIEAVRKIFRSGGRSESRRTIKNS